MGTYEGHDALRAAYAGWEPRRPQRHLVVNTHITDWDDHEAKAVSDVVFLLQGKDGWTVQLVGRYHDVLHHDDGTLALPPPHGGVRGPLGARPPGSLTKNSRAVFVFVCCSPPRSTPRE